MKFYASVRLEVRKKEDLKQGGEAVGSRIRVRVVKNKVAPPFRQAELELLYGQGISREGSLLDLAVSTNVIQRSGTWYSFGEERLGQGRENAREYLKEHPELARQIEQRVRQILLAEGARLPVLEETASTTTEEE